VSKEQSVPTPYEKLQQEILAYGDAAMENLLRCRSFANAVIEGLPDYLQCPKDMVVAVPAEGPFDPRHEYGEAAFSFHGQQVIRLEPVVFGICVIVGNAEDSGSLWLRTGVRVEITGDTFDVYVANQPIVRIDKDYTGKLEPIWDVIFKELLSVFKQELADFNDDRFEHGIGFIANPE
jgi:hypothetical protein